LQADATDGTQAKSAAPVQTPEAQCRGNYRFAYSLTPHGQDLLPAWQQAWTFQTALRGMLTSGHPGILPASHSLVTVDSSAFVLSAIKIAANGEGLIVRGYSISDKPQQVRLKLGFPAARAELARVDETPTGQTIKPDAHGCCKLKVRPAEIVTLRVIPAAL
jgi:alpha-mannosidase